MSEPITSLVSRSDGRAVGSLGAAGHRVAFHTAGELWDRGKDDMPSDLVASEHLIYSSPAALSFNSPGAEGFGVKRAGLSIPGSVMLIVSPGCCGRNTSSISSLPGYEGRFFYLTMGETDLVTGRHLDRIPKVVAAVCAGLAQPPSVVMVCITCVDALLGTDMERVCRRAEALAGVRVRPCYMYALTREGRRPPMVHVRQSLYSLLEPRRRDPRSCNLLGFFAPVERDSDLRVLLRQAGLRHVREISTSADYDDFQRMASANFNLVLNPEARAAAQDLRERLGTPYIELARLYQVDRIRRQYDALASALGVRFDQAAFEAEAQQSARSFVARHGGEVFAVGECANADPFELAVALVRAGLGVAEIFGTLSPERYVYLRHLAALSPDTRIYSNLGPSMIHYDPAGSGVTVTIGRDAGSYHPSCPNLAWSDEGQPFGYRAVSGLFSALDGLLSGGGRGRGSALSLADEHRAAMSRPAGEGACDLVQLPSGCAVLPPAHEVRGLRRALTPFAPTSRAPSPCSMGWAACPLSWTRAAARATSVALTSRAGSRAEMPSSVPACVTWMPSSVATTCWWKSSRMPQHRRAHPLRPSWARPSPRSSAPTCMPWRAWSSGASACPAWPWKPTAWRFTTRGPRRPTVRSLRPSPAGTPVAGTILRPLRSSQVSSVSWARPRSISPTPRRESASPPTCADRDGVASSALAWGHASMTCAQPAGPSATSWWRLPASLRPGGSSVASVRPSTSTSRWQTACSQPLTGREGACWWFISRSWPMP